MNDCANYSFMHAIRQALEASIGAGLERLHGVARTGADCIVVRLTPTFRRRNCAS